MLNITIAFALYVNYLGYCSLVRLRGLNISVHNVKNTRLFFLIVTKLQSRGGSVPYEFQSPNISRMQPFLSTEKCI